MNHEPPNDEELSFVVTDPKDVVDIVIDDRILLNVNHPTQNFLDFFRHHVSEIVSNVLYKLPSIPQMSIFLAHAIQVLTSKNKDIRNVMTEDENLLKIILEFPNHAVETSPIARGCYCKVLEQVIIMSDYDYLSKIKNGRPFLKSLLDITYFTSVFDFLMNFVSSLVYSIIRFLEENSFTDLLLEYAFAEKCQEQCLKIADTLTRQLPRNLPLVKPLQDPETILKLLDLGFTRHSCAAMEVILSMHSQPHPLSRPMINSINNEYDRICKYIINTKKFDQFSVLLIYLLTSIVNDIYCPLENYVHVEPAKIDYSTKKCLPKSDTNQQTDQTSNESENGENIPVNIAKEEILSKSSIIQKRTSKRKSGFNKMRLNLSEFSQTRHSLDPSEVLRVHQAVKLPDVGGSEEYSEASGSNAENDELFNREQKDGLQIFQQGENIEQLVKRKNRRPRMIRHRPASFSTKAQKEEGKFGQPIYDRTKDHDNEINRINIAHHSSDNLQSIINCERKSRLVPRPPGKAKEGRLDAACGAESGQVKTENGQLGTITEEQEIGNNQLEAITEEQESNQLEAITEEPEIGNNQLGTITEEPENVQLETITEEPEAENNQLETITEEPEIGNNQLGTITEEPENVQLETITEEPEIDNNQLETITEEPEAENNQLETITEEPEIDNNQQSTIEEDPEADKYQLETIAEEPEDENGQLSTITEDHEVDNDQLETISEEPEPGNGQLGTIIEEAEDENDHLGAITEDQEVNEEQLATITEEPEVDNDHLQAIIEEPENENESSQLATIMEDPEIDNGNLETITEDPENENNQLSTIVEEPENESSQLETITEEPDIEHVQLSTITEDPEVDNDHLEAIIEEPENENNQMTTITEEPEVDNDHIEAIIEEPETGSSQLSTITEEPVNESIQLGTITEEPEIGNDQLSTITEESGIDNSHLNTIIEEPENENNQLSTITEESEVDNDQLYAIVEEPEQGMSQLSTITEDPEVDGSQHDPNTEDGSVQTSPKAENSQEDDNPLKSLLKKHSQGNLKVKKSVKMSKKGKKSTTKTQPIRMKITQKWYGTPTAEDLFKLQHTTYHNNHPIPSLGTIVEETNENEETMNPINEDPHTDNSLLSPISENDESEGEMNQNHLGVIIEDDISQGSKSPLDTLLEAHGQTRIEKSVKLIKNKQQPIHPKVNKHHQREWCGTPTVKDITGMNDSIFENQMSSPPLGTITEEDNNGSFLSPISEDDQYESFPQRNSKSAPTSATTTPLKKVFSKPPNVLLSTNKFSTSPISAALTSESKRLIDNLGVMANGELFQSTIKPPECPTPPAQSFSVFSETQGTTNSVLNEDIKKDTMINNSFSTPAQLFYNRRHSSPFNFIPRSIPFPEKNSSSSISSSSSKEDNQIAPEDEETSKSASISPVSSNSTIPSPRRFSQPTFNQFKAAATTNGMNINENNNVNNIDENGADNNKSSPFPSLSQIAHISNASSLGNAGIYQSNLPPIKRNNLYKSEAVFHPFALFTSDRGRIRNSNPAVSLTRITDGLKSPITTDPKTGEKLTLLDFARQASPQMKTETTNETQIQTNESKTNEMNHNIMNMNNLSILDNLNKMKQQNEDENQNETENMMFSPIEEIDESGDLPTTPNKFEVDESKTDENSSFQNELNRNGINDNENNNERNEIDETNENGNGNENMDMNVISVHLDREEIITTMVFMINAFFENKTNSFLHNAIIQICTSLFDYTSIVAEIISRSQLPNKILDMYANKDNIRASFWGQLHHMVEFVQSSPEIVPESVKEKWDLYINNKYHRDEEIMANSYGNPDN